MFEYLKPYVDDQKIEIFNSENSFHSVKTSEITKAEERLGFSFPEQLKIFYHEIGYGGLTSPHNPPDGYIFYSANTIHSPDTIADMVLLGQESSYIAEMTHQFLQPGDLPFFEIGDSTRFLIMKTQSDNPNAVWNTSGRVKIEDSLERFIWRMYYEDPAYYDDIIEAFYKAVGSTA